MFVRAGRAEFLALLYGPFECDNDAGFVLGTLKKEEKMQKKTTGFVDPANGEITRFAAVSRGRLYGAGERNALRRLTFIVPKKTRATVTNDR